MGSRQITEQDRERVARDLQVLTDGGAEVTSQRGMLYRVRYGKESAYYWPMSNTYKMLKTNRSFNPLRSQNPPLKLLEQLKRANGEIQ